ncbi:MAG: hypothetical protein ACR2MP_02400 [Streptosporangiaceae bacterium]
MGGLSAIAASFAAGILNHAPALLAFTAPSIVSSHRLGPGHWSADGPRFAARDREALLRIPGTGPPRASGSWTCAALPGRWPRTASGTR